MRLSIRDDHERGTTGIAMTSISTRGTTAKLPGFDDYNSKIRSALVKLSCNIDAGDSTANDNNVSF